MVTSGLAFAGCYGLAAAMSLSLWVLVASLQRGVGASGQSELPGALKLLWQCTLGMLLLVPLIISPFLAEMVQSALTPLPPELAGVRLWGIFVGHLVGLQMAQDVHRCGDLKALLFSYRGIGMFATHLAFSVAVAVTATEVLRETDGPEMGFLFAVVALTQFVGGCLIFGVWRRVLDAS